MRGCLNAYAGISSCISGMCLAETYPKFNALITCCNVIKAVLQKRGLNVAWKLQKAKCGVVGASVWSVPVQASDYCNSISMWAQTKTGQTRGREPGCKEENTRRSPSINGKYVNLIIHVVGTIQSPSRCYAILSQFHVMFWGLIGTSTAPETSVTLWHRDIV